MNRYVKIIFAGLAGLLAAGCWGSGDNSPDKGLAPTTDAQAISSVTVTVSSAAPIVNLPSSATLDLSGQTSLFGSSVTLSKVQNETLNALAESEQALLRADLANSYVIEIRLAGLPDSDVPITIFAHDVVQRSSSSSLAAIYVYSITDEETSDGEGGFSSIIPIASRSRSADGSVSGMLSWWHFQPDGRGSYIARLKVGLASGTRVPSAASRGPPGAAALTPAVPTLVIPCPFSPPSIGPTFPQQVPTALGPPCIETSRFNPVRSIPEYGHPRPHKGMDLRATVGTPVFAPTGGIPVPNKSVTKRQYEQRGSPPTGSGVMLTLDYGAYRIVFMHLNEIDASLLTDAGELNDRARTSANRRVGLTGGTGQGVRAPHLHYELHGPGVGLDGELSTGDIHLLGEGPVDPFPYLATNFGLIERNGNFKLEASKSYVFEVSASDIYGVPVLSDVPDARENGGEPPSRGSTARYGPTRKFCLRADPASTLNLIQPANGFRGIGGRICAPWGSAINAIGTADQPDTVIEARYSLRPELSVSLDPLSSVVARRTLLYLRVFYLPDCISRPIVFTAPDQLCSQTYVDIPDDGLPGIPGNSIVLVSSNPQIVSARLVIVDSATFQVLYTSGVVHGNASVRMYSDSAYLHTENFINNDGFLH